MSSRFIRESPIHEHQVVVSSVLELPIDWVRHVEDVEVLLDSDDVAPLLHLVDAHRQRQDHGDDPSENDQNLKDDTLTRHCSFDAFAPRLKRYRCVHLSLSKKSIIINSFSRSQ